MERNEWKRNEWKPNERNLSEWNLNEWIEKMKNRNAGPNPPGYLCRTYGCQMNARDSEKLSGLLEAMGFRPVASEAEADFIIFNTCCVRENAENKILGHLGRLKALKAARPQLRVALCGCMVQQEAAVEKIRAAHGFVDILFGTFNLHRLPELLWASYETGGPVVDIWRDHGPFADDLPVRREFSYKSGVNIMYGCDNFCAYCVVPYVRGRPRSRPPGEILREISGLVADGVTEVLLLGQNVNAYSAQGHSFPDLLARVRGLAGLRRVRFMTSHPKDFSDALIHTLALGGNLCPQVHLPVQSGSTEILRKMNRGYSREAYLSLVGRLRQALPQAALTTDIIVGFPGETEADFADTLSLVQAAAFDNAFTFLYSPRAGTPAAGLPGQVPEPVAKERFNRLLAALAPIALKKNRALVGTAQEVLVEGRAQGRYTGRTAGNKLVHFPGPPMEPAMHPGLVVPNPKDGIWNCSPLHPGDYVRVRVTDCKTYYLIGVLEPPAPEGDSPPA
jgi:tRNA-2-methylthio-N6-dimethylallyladenosine synthase